MKVYLVWYQEYGGMFSSPDKLARIYLTRELAEASLGRGDWVEEKEILAD